MKTEAQEKWKISLGALNLGDIEIGDEHGDIVVTVHTMQRRYHKNTAKAWATAQMIGAAPDMLAALKAFARSQEGELGERDVISVYGQDILAARAAIAKATKGAK